MKKSSTDASKLIAEKARYLAKTLEQYARVLEGDALSKDDRARFEADVTALYETHKRCARKSEAQVVGWLGKYVRDAADGQGSVQSVIEDMARQAPHLEERLREAESEIEAVIKATANKGGGRPGPRGMEGSPGTTSTLDPVRASLLIKIGLMPVGRKSWDRHVAACPGTKGRRENARR